MRISDATCYTYALPLRQPLELGGQTVRRRRGVLLRVTGAEGAVGWGEAAPLPGFSAESAADASEALSVRADALRGRDCPDDPGRLLERETPAAPPSVQFAVQSALLELRAARADVPGARLLGKVLGKGRETVPLNALISAETGDLAAHGKRLRRAGFGAVKLKVGRAAPETDAERVRELDSGLGGDVSLRLDANRAWSLDAATAFAAAVAPVPIEYVEEPLARPNRLAEFAERTGLSAALDETTREQEPGGDVEGAEGIAAVVLKPTLLGRLAVVRRWQAWADSVGAATVVSSSYESGVGTRMLLTLAAAWSDVPAGLSAHMRLADDVLRPRVQVDGPAASATAGQQSRVDLSRLSRVGST